MRPIFVALAVAALSACSASSTEPSLTAAQARVGLSTVRLDMTASTIRVPPGVRDTLHATLTNDGPTAVTLHFPSGCIMLPYIRNSAGTIVLPSGGGWICTAVIGVVTLSPGESRTADFIWDGHDVFATEMPLLGRLPAGTYYATVEVLATEVQLRTSPLAIELQ